VNKKLERLLSLARAAPFPSAVCAHRGASTTAPENTLAAFRAAAQGPSEIVELDVYLTRDEELVVFHDEKLERTTGGEKGRVVDLTLEEIRAFDVGAWFGERFAGERVPRLAEAIAAIGRRATPMIEVKEAQKRAPALVERLAQGLAEAGAEARAIVLVWDDETARSVRERLPGALLALVAFTRRAIRRAAAGGLDGVMPYYRSATRRFIAEAHEAELFVAPWTVNRAKDLEFFARAGCDAIVTDVPETARDVLERLELERGQRFLKYIRETG
jgi:glycerophosphoryl diester phosphodiesterase